MDEDKTTPEPNLPDDNENNKEKTAFFDLNRKNPSSYGKNRYQNNKDSDDHYSDWYKEYKPQTTEPVGAYEEIVDDLISIISKLLKELSKRK